MNSKVEQIAVEQQAASPALRVALFLDGASLSDMEAAVQKGVVEGFTTNPTLAAKAGVKDYRAFGESAVARSNGMPISFEVLADDFEDMGAQAREIASWGRNVYVKVPVCNTRGESSIPLIADLAREGVRVNVTAMMTLDQVREVAAVMPEATPGIVSIFAGRIADTGVDPVPMMREAVQICRSRPQLQVLWASPREVLNVYQADECGVHIIVLTADLLAKLPLRGKDLAEYARETVQMFYDDGLKAGYTI